jgi:hypothetical protein
LLLHCWGAVILYQRMHNIWMLTCQE